MHYEVLTCRQCNHPVKRSAAERTSADQGQVIYAILTHPYTDFHVRADGFGGFLVLDRSLTPRQAGRMVQRLFEIETYRMMALLALPLVRPLSAQIAASEEALSALTTQLASPGAGDDALLQQLTKLAAEVQGAVTRTQFRFNACRAYHALVKTRIAALREHRLSGIQPIDEFMSRRFSPAVATCASTAQRLRDLSERVGQASALLSTRVDFAYNRQWRAYPWRRSFIMGPGLSAT